MDQDRVAKAWALIAAHAVRDGVPVSLHHVCTACAEAVHTSGAGMLITRGQGLGDPVLATDENTAELEELQFTLGEGPCADALSGDGPVLAADLSSAESRLRWPVLAPAAVRCRMLAIFSFPLQLGAVRVGVLNLYRDRAGPLLGGELADALIYADAALLLVLDDRGGIDAALRSVRGGFDEWRSEVHQAAGMVSAQLDVGVEDALVRLRAFAYAQDRRLARVARDVLERRLRFTREHGPGPDLGEEPDREPA